MKGELVKRALASCRRVFLLLLLAITVAGSWVYWQSPTLDSLRPSIEQYLAQNLELKKVQLGGLSWYWAGHLWLRSDKLDFINSQEDVAFHDGGVAVRLPLSSLLTGAIQPDRIRLNGGTLNLRHNAESSAPIPAEQIILEDVTLNWSYKEMHGSLPGLRLTLDGDSSKLDAVSSVLSLHAQLDSDGLPKQLTMSCSHINWLPEKMRQQMQGSPRINIKLQRTSQHDWHILASAQSAQPVTLFPETIYAYSLNRIETEMNIRMKQLEPIQLEQVDISKVFWALGDNSISANGKWHEGRLTASATSDQLAMPLIWSWLRPLGDEAWQNWLSMMQAGSAKQIKGQLSLTWQNPLSSLPTSDAWKNMQYQLAAEIEQTDIALGLSEDFLLQTHASVKLNQSGLNADIIDAELPRQLGHSTGSLYIPWQTLELHVSGQSDVDVASLLRWFGPSHISDWQWGQAKASSTFELIWDPSQPEPAQATATLNPIGDWNVSIHDAALKLSTGSAQWDQQHGLNISGMHFQSEHMQGTLSLSTAAGADGNWRITEMDAKGESDFSAVAAHFQLPVSDADGTIKTELHFDKTWSGHIDMTAAGWQHLLGSSKDAGEAYRINFAGDVELNEAIPTIHMTKLESEGAALLIHSGIVKINRDAFSLYLNDLHTPSFSGSLDIRIPFADTPWSLSTKVRYLNRNALPEALDHPDQLIEQSWILTADIERFDWNDAQMNGVSIKLASAKNSLGRLKAKKISTAQLNITDVDAIFSLPGKGTVDLRKLSAHVEKQTLTMSATLTPESEGGMHWRGFAELGGDFGHLMKFGDLSKRFSNGDGHLLFSGQGIILKNQPWWQGIDGRLRLRVDDGRILEGGTLTTLLAAFNLTELYKLLLGQRKDLSGPGIMYERLQMEAIMQNQNIQIRNVALRSSAFDLVGQGTMDINQANIDLYLVAQPLQNLDALLAKIPLLRDLLGGKSHSLMRKIYHMHGPFTDAQVEAVSAEDAGLASPGIVERLFNLPTEWFGS
ncbi:hypothetical protein MMIC_P0552 [Mariprofundus micogutta]|uniref:Uncharacterized protein n=1 Tax=Mariprofundus micogutta TaxID=1921010 RepID=A0A1L8CL15_9PROT|nr:AsmA-like C-terminal domain-containing protein [Mariprofundus micogutta]GAV19604.1 hypothetical protein MMIC_P0552 [Mariprofundus micogutta]